MRNVTICMDEVVASWTRIAAAKHEQSISRFVGEVLREKMEADQSYELAMRAFLATPPTAGSGPEPSLPETRCTTVLAFVDSNVLVAMSW
jgi:hypothetical protein